MTREDAIEDLLARLSAAADDAAGLGMDMAAYLLNVAMLEVVDRANKAPAVIPSQAERR
jgi:hypothetical protein